jgi:hypothetical protein
LDDLDEERALGPSGSPEGRIACRLHSEEQVRRGSLLELDSILASLASDAGLRVEALYSAPAPKSLWANLLAKKGLRLPSEDRVVVLRR